MNLIKFLVAPLLALSLAASAMQQAPNINTAYKLEPDAYGHLWIVSNFFYQDGTFVKQEIISAWKNDQGVNEYCGFTTQPEPLKEEYIKSRIKFYVLGHLRASDFHLNLEGLRLAAQINDEETDKKIADQNEKKAEKEMAKTNSALKPEEQAYAERRFQYFLEKSIQHELSCPSPMKF